VPEFAPGDTVRVRVKVVEGSRERVQTFEGVCIARTNDGLNSSLTVRKISYGEGVERVFPLYSPNITEIEVVRRGAVRRAKLYYLRGLTGKRARIAEKVEHRGAKGKAGVAVAADLALETGEAPTDAADTTGAQEPEADAKKGEKDKGEKKRKLWGRKKGKAKAKGEDGAETPDEGKEKSKGKGKKS